MTLEQAIKMLVGKNGRQWQLGKVLGCTQAAIAQWNPEEIPWARELQVNDILRKQKAKEQWEKDAKARKKTKEKKAEK